MISNRPSWANLGGNKINTINNRWGNQVGGLHDWRGRNPGRVDYWDRWGGGIRHNWDHYHHHNNWFGPSWWNDHRHYWGGWHYGNSFARHDFNYWWTIPTFAACTSWFNWSAPATVWSEPVYYDYGSGGNVVYEENSVYINGQPIATQAEFAQSAMELATVPPPSDEQVAEEADWMPLGTFAVSTDEKDLEPSRAIQLAVNKDGIVSGTLYNYETDQAHTVQGQVDQETQRVAFRIGESEDVVVETGLYNLTLDEAPALVHFGPDQSEDWLLVRLDAPEDEGGDETAGPRPV